MPFVETTRLFRLARRFKRFSRSPPTLARALSAEHFRYWVCCRSSPATSEPSVPRPFGKWVDFVRFGEKTSNSHFVSMADASESFLTRIQSSLRSVRLASLLFGANVFVGCAAISRSHGYTGSSSGPPRPSHSHSTSRLIISRKLSSHFSKFFPFLSFFAWLCRGVTRSSGGRTRSSTFAPSPSFLFPFTAYFLTGVLKS